MSGASRVSLHTAAFWLMHGTAKDTEIVRRLKEGNRAIATFSSKGHELFATVHDSLQLDNDRRNIDRLWNRFVAAWFEGGKDGLSVSCRRAR
jgi:general stress protein 26